MITWTKQGDAFVGAVHLLSGEQAQVVLVAGRENPKGAMIIQSATDGAGKSAPISSSLDSLSAENVTDILCAQERAYGDSDLDEL